VESLLNPDPDAKEVQGSLVLLATCDKENLPLNHQESPSNSGPPETFVHALHSLFFPFRTPAVPPPPLSETASLDKPLPGQESPEPSKNRKKPNRKPRSVQLTWGDRHKTEPWQKAMLEFMFATPTPSAATKTMLSQHLKMTPRQIQVWFQNRRARTKKNQRRKLLSVD